MLVTRLGKPGAQVVPPPPAARDDGWLGCMRELTDALYGEVWLCSGQSNMEWPVMAADEAAMEIVAATYAKIRLFHVPKVPAGSPMADVAAHWQPTSPETIATFSAVCYYFGREIHSALNVPVGLIASAWGGTKIEPWTPPAGFRSVDGLGPMADYALATDASHRQQPPATLEAVEAWVGEHARGAGERRTHHADSGERPSAGAGDTADRPVQRDDPSARAVRDSWGALVSGRRTRCARS